MMLNACKRFFLIGLFVISGLGLAACGGGNGDASQSFKDGWNAYVTQSIDDSGRNELHCTGTFQDNESFGNSLCASYFIYDYKNDSWSDFSAGWTSASDANASNPYGASH